MRPTTERCVHLTVQVRQSAENFAGVASYRRQLVFTERTGERRHAVLASGDDLNLISDVRICLDDRALIEFGPRSPSTARSVAPGAPRAVDLAASSEHRIRLAIYAQGSLWRLGGAGPSEQDQNADDKHPV